MGAKGTVMGGALPLPNCLVTLMLAFYLDPEDGLVCGEGWVLGHSVILPNVTTL